MKRSKCARCGKIGHCARDCANEPDERGRRRQAGFGGFQAGSAGADAIPQGACCQERATQADAAGFAFTFFVVSNAIKTTVVLQVQMGFGLVDAGAQRGVRGPGKFDLPVKFLG